MTLVAAWRRIESELPRNWGDARLRLVVEDESHASRAAALLGPAMPGRSGKEIRFYCARRGAGIGPDAIVRLLERLDEEKLVGRLDLIAAGEPTTHGEPAAPTLKRSWDAALAALPPDWSDLYAEVELSSTDYLERAALLLSPVNPTRFAGAVGFRYRCARSTGYGASAEMAGRCLERLDAEHIRGGVRVLHALSDTHHVGTQGPVFRLQGKAV